MSTRRGAWRNNSIVSRARRAEVFARDGYACVQCGRTEYLTIDHIIPRRFGGSNDVANLQTLCTTCNFRKADTVTVWPT
jgi:5-methylcytosine-specific restriction endonuclease McrA